MTVSERSLSKETTSEHLASPQQKQTYWRYWVKRLGQYVVILLLLGVGTILILDQLIGLSVRYKIYTDITQVPYRPYGLLLGTAKYVAPNSLNLYYHYRLLATANLFHQQKVDYLLLSGDNRTFRYNEPRNMYRDMRKLNVPEAFLYLDFAGFRTLDSVIRADKIFNITPMTIISQKFHCERALFIASFYNIDAICFVADSPESSFSVRFREIFARMQMIWDLLTQKEPHFLGQPEPLPSPIHLF